MGTPKAHSDQDLNRGVAAYQKIVHAQKSSPVEEPAAPAVCEKPLIKKTKTNALKASSQTDETEAQRFLRETLGAEKGDALYKKVPKTADKIFDFLEDFSARQLSLFFRDESIAAEALVLSRLPSKLAAEVLADAGPERKAELVKRIAHLGETSPEVLERTASALREKARRFSLSLESEEGAEIDGMGVLTAILKAGESSFGGKLLSELEKDDPGLGRFIKDRFYTLEDAASMPDRVMEEKLRAMTDHEIIFLLKSPLGAFKQKIIANLSEGREERIVEEAEILGPVPKIEVEAAAREFMEWFRKEGPWVEDEYV